MTNRETVTCDCGNDFRKDGEKGYYKKRPNGSNEATCPECMHHANKIADAYADP